MNLLEKEPKTRRKINKKLKDFILKRDNYKCQAQRGSKCNKGKLEVHHIDYNPNNNKINNLITLCNFHNSSISNHKFSNKEWWIGYFKEKMENVIYVGGKKNESK